MFSTITLNGYDFITMDGYALYNDEWITIAELLDIENDMMWYFDNYDDWCKENPEPRMWGLSL